MTDERPFEWRWRIIQGGFQVCGGVTASKARMLSEMLHYAAQYADEGPFEMQTRTGKNKWRRYVP